MQVVSANNEDEYIIGLLLLCEEKLTDIWNNNLKEHFFATHKK